MSNSRKRLGYVVIGVVVYAVALTVFWAARPLVDDVPVGMDWTPTVQDPPKAQRLVSQRWRAARCSPPTATGRTTPRPRRAARGPRSARLPTRALRAGAA
ncbi:MAG: hypothetical protein R2713_09415 [Ilumatobacteraceae bacterium]